MCERKEEKEGLRRGGRKAIKKMKRNFRLWKIGKKGKRREREKKNKERERDYKEQSDRRDYASDICLKKNIKEKKNNGEKGEETDLEGW